MNMLRKQKGFTLIELVMIIVILGILAAVAIPRYINLQTEAQTAALDGVEGSLKSSAAILIVSSFAGKPRGTVATRAQVIANTDLSAGANAVPGGAAGDIVIFVNNLAANRTIAMGGLTSD